MTLLSGSKVLKTYKVALGSVPAGPKRIEGDHKTPEGSYVIDKGCAQPVPFVAAHLLSQRGRSTKSAQPRRTTRRSNHDSWTGQPFAYLGPLHRQTDWTDGCIAVTNGEIEEIWKMVSIGTRVEIRP